MSPDLTLSGGAGRIQGSAAADEPTLPSVTDCAYWTLREAIVTAELAPGLKLSADELADELGFGEKAIRSALARLQDETLIAIVPHLGTYVTLIGAAAVGHAEFVREALECAAMVPAAANITAEALEELHRNLQAQERACSADDDREFDRLDKDLHRCLCEASGRMPQWALYQCANAQLDRVRRLSLRDPDFLAHMLAQHIGLVAAVAAGDGPAAEAAMRQHLRAVAAGLPELLKRSPEYFE